jgi:hypothetical protein
LCPGNKRAATQEGQEPPANPNYSNTFVFTNDFSALLPPTENFLESCPPSDDPEQQRLGNIYEG